MAKLGKPLNDRELEVLRCMAERGLREREAAVQLHLSEGGVHGRIKNAFVKLGVHTLTAAIARVPELHESSSVKPLIVEVCDPRYLHIIWLFGEGDSKKLVASKLGLTADQIKHRLKILGRGLNARPDWTPMYHIYYLARHHRLTFQFLSPSQRDVLHQLISLNRDIEEVATNLGRTPADVKEVADSALTALRATSPSEAKALVGKWAIFHLPQPFSRLEWKE